MTFSKNDDRWHSAAHKAATLLSHRLFIRYIRTFLRGSDYLFTPMSAGRSWAFHRFFDYFA